MCSLKALQIIVFISTALCLIAGIPQIVVGLANYHKNLDLILKDGPNLRVIPNAVLALGIVMILVSIFGLFANYKANTKLIVPYAVILIFLVICQIVTAICTFNENNRREIIDTFYITFDKNTTFSRASFFAMEQVFNCCGVESENDYKRIGIPIPGTCCGKPLTATCKYVGAPGCADMFAKSIDKALSRQGMFAVIPVPLEIWTTIFTVCLAVKA